MMLARATWLVAASISFFSAKANADVVFIDLNKAPQEVEAARKAASNLGEKLIVISASSARELTSSNVVSRINSNADVQSAAALRIIVSGHRAKDDFFGENGRVNIARLSEGLESGLRNKVTTMFFAGCYYTGLGGSIRARHLFPNALVVGGYKRKGFLKEVPIGHRYMTSFMSASKRLENTHSQQQAESIVRSLSGWNDRAACVVQGYWIDSKTTIELSQARNFCEAVEKSGQESLVNCLYNFERTCGDVPTDTQSGPVRKHYEHLADTDHCNDLYPPGSRIGLNAITRLIFDHNVRAHLERNFADDLPRLDEILLARGYPQGQPLKGFSSLPRYEIMKRFDDALSVLRYHCEEQNKVGGLCNAKQKADYHWAIDRIEAMKEVYTDPDRCIPPEWINELSEVPTHIPDSCGHKQRAVQASNDAQMAASNERAAKLLVTRVLTQQNVDRIRPYLEQMKSAQAAGDRNRYRDAEIDYRRTQMAIIEQTEGLEEVIQAELGRVPAHLANSVRNGISERLFKRYDVMLRHQYNVSDFPNASN